MKDQRTGVLIILDGFGINPSSASNAVALAEAPTLHRLLKDYPHTQIDASEAHVGLPAGFMGNSEVGHLNLGAGRVVYQDFSLISKAVEDGSFFANPALAKLFADLRAGAKAGALHLVGLLSDGGVHSHISHLFALLRMAKSAGVQKVFVHAILDGRDTPPTSGQKYLQELQSYLADLGVGEVATVSGRFYAMDRDNRWERTERGYLAIVCGEAEAQFVSPLAYTQSEYAAAITDEFVNPAVSRAYRGIQDGDGVVFFNFRADRARQLARAMTQAEFAHFPRKQFPTLRGFVCLTRYDESLGLPVAYEKVRVPHTLGAVVAQTGAKQLRIAETEKYAHVTYFFNGGEEAPFPGEKRVLIPSPREVKTYDLKPEMSAEAVCDALLKELSSTDYLLAVVNFANCDMVGHTGNLAAAIKAVETVDRCVARIVEWVEAHQAFALLTADHGNCEKMLDDTGCPLTAHTTLPVPLVLIDPLRRVASLRDGGKLCDIAPTLLALWGMTQPVEMTGQSLVSA